MPQIYGSEKLEKATHFMCQSFASILLKNKGNGQFRVRKLPNEAQFSPTLSMEITDINMEGYLAILGLGNVYQSEVETIRYDASKAYVLLGNKTGNYEFLNDPSYYSNQKTKAIKKIIIKGVLHFIILNKNKKLTILKSDKTNTRPLFILVVL
jgi:hypothetical protein